MTDRSLLAKDFKAGQLPAGPKGDRGPSGLRPNQTLEISGLSATSGTPTSFGCVDLDTTSTLIDLPLPAGAVITGARARYIDSADQDLQFVLEVVNFDGTATHQILASGGSSNSPSEGNTTITSDPGTVFPAVSDRTYYYLGANPVTNHSGELSFCGAAVASC